MASISSKYAERRAMFEDIERALTPALRGMFSPMKVNVCIVDMPALAVVVQLSGYRSTEMPPEARAEMERFMSAARDECAKRFPTLPLAWEITRPPTHAAWGFIARLAEETVDPHYPEIINAGSVRLVPSDHMRRRLLAGI